MSMCDFCETIYPDAESREVAKTLIGLANELEWIEKKYAKTEKSEET